MRDRLSNLPRGNWLHFLRARDLAQILAATPEPLHGPILEVGCGDGFLTALLRQRFKQVIPIDIKPRDRVDDLCIASAEALPFPDDCFGLVFSSNVMEHIRNLTACFEELRGVMRDDAIMIHAMPTPIWSALQFALLPVHLLLHSILPRLTGARDKAKSTAEFSSSVFATQSKPEVSRDKNLKQFWTRLKAALWPPIHGVASSHIEEFRRFRTAWWTDRFHASGFIVFRTAPLYLHSAYRLFPYRGLRFREIVSRAGLSSVTAYWARKAP